ALSPQVLRDLYRDRWPVEQLPLAAKQMLGAARQFVHEQETCQRFPELALLAGAVLTYAAATSPAVPTGSWDRLPRRTPGRLRRATSAPARQPGASAYQVDSSGLHRVRDLEEARLAVEVGPLEGLPELVGEEAIERLSRLPDLDHAPAALGRPGYMGPHALGR